MPSNKVDIQESPSLWPQVCATGTTGSEAAGAGGPDRLIWHFAPAVSRDLQGAIRQIPWDELTTCPAAERVKVAENRDVWRIELSGKTIYAKCYRSRGPVKQLLESVRGLAAKREWRALRHASKLGVPAPDPLGYARAGTSRRDGYHAVLVTAAMPADALSLEEAWREVSAQPASPAVCQQKRRLLHALAELIAKAHAGGLFHRDLHVRNILLFQNGHGPSAAMIDLHNAHLSRGIYPAGVRSNLVQLNQWFSRHASRTDRLRFVKIYCEHLHERLGAAGMRKDAIGRLYNPKELCREVVRQSRRYAARLHRKRDRRILKRNKYFASLELSKGWLARIALDIKHGRPYSHPLDELPSRQDWRGMIGEPAGLLDSGSARVLKDSGNRRVLQASLRFSGADWTIIVKHERDGSLMSRLAGRMGKASLQREFVTGWKCLHRELPVALPLAMLARAAPSGQEFALLVEYIPESRDLDTFGKLHLPELPPQQARIAKRRICDELARTLRRMWSCRLAHRDLKAGNIRVQIPGGDLENLRIVLVDVVGIRRPYWGVRNALLRSLARLDASFANCPSVTRTDRLRLLLAVLRGVDGGAPNWKQAWHRIARLSRRDQATIARTMPWLQPIAGAAGAQ